PIMAGEKKSGSFGFELRHQLAITAITYIVLRNSPGVKKAVLKSGLAANAEERAQVFARERYDFVGRQRSQFRVPLAANIAGESHVAGGRAVRKQRRRKNCAQDFEAFHPRYQHTESCAGMRHILAPEAQDDT